MSVSAPEAPAPSAPAPAAPAAPAAPSAPAGAQAVAAAPAGTIPKPIIAYSDRPDSAKSKMMARLESKVKQSGAPEGQKSAPKVSEAPAPQAAPDDEKSGAAAGAEEDAMGEVPAAEEAKAPKESAKTEEGKADDKKKPNPWKMYEESKAKLAAAERELSEIRKLSPNAEARKQELAEIESIKHKNQQLEEKIRLVDYQSSEQFKQEVEKPYTEQWRRSMAELKGVELESDDSDPRPIEPKDMLELVNMSTAEARKACDKAFGISANDVMLQREKIRDQFEKRTAALENAKKNGDEHLKGQQRQTQEQMQAMASELKSAYDSSVESIMKDPRHAPYLTEREGDEEGNTMIRKGYAFVDDAFKQSPTNPNLSAAERASIVKRHAAVRHKAAAYNRLIRDISSERKAHAATKAKLQAYEKTVPNRQSTAETQGGAYAPAAGNKMSGLMNRLRKKAVPARAA